MPAIERNDAVAAVNCPQCGKSIEATAENRWKPFCSKRCKLGDLGNWFAGRYAIPEDPEREPPEDQEPRQ